MMVGAEIPPIVDKTRAGAGEIVLEVKQLSVYDDRGLEAVKGVTFDVRKAEIIGIAGVSGNGQRELVQAIVGLRKPSSGSLMFAGQDITGKPPRRMIDLGLAYVPENRTEDASIADFRLDENMILKDFDKPPICNRLVDRITTLLNEKEITRRGSEAVKQYNIMTTGISAKAKSLSGGNLQKLILARELSGQPSLIVVSQPTRGLDIAATEFVRSIMVQQRNRGAAILLVDEDLSELIALSDRVAVMYKGQIVGLLEPGQFNLEEIGLLMTGAKKMSLAA